MDEVSIIIREMHTFENDFITLNENNFLGSTFGLYYLSDYVPSHWI